VNLFLSTSPRGKSANWHVLLLVFYLAAGAAAHAEVNPQNFLYSFEIDREAGERYQPEDTADSERREYKRLIELFARHFVTKYSTPSLRSGHQDQGDKGYALRAVHAKGHGCLVGSFEVDEIQDAGYRHSIFKSSRTYPIIARFSNGDGPPVRDGNRTISIGLAFKVLDVKVPKLLPQQSEESVDFLLTNHPEFIARNISDFAEVIEGRENGLLDKLGAIWASGRGLYRRLWIAKEDPLVTPYWGNLPFKLGDRVVKYLVRPEACPGQQGPVKIITKSGPDFLSAALTEHMSGQSACFGFYLQKKGTDLESPVEDATVAWPEGEDFLERVGTVFFPIQPPNELLPEMGLPNASGLDGKQICQHLSFSPWNTTGDFKPLSSLNRARRVIYELSVALRREINRSHNPAER